VAIVRHDRHPYLGTWKESGGLEGLARIAGEYLRRINPRLGLPRPWLNSLTAEVSIPGNQEHLVLRWFLGTGDPRDSRWVSRHDASKPDSAPLDRSAVLVAGLCIGSGKTFTRLYGGQGLRVVVQIGPPDPGGTAPVRITGVSSTLPEASPRAWAGRLQRVPFQALRTAVERDIAGTFGLTDAHEIVETGYRLPDATMRGAPFLFVTARTAPMKNRDEGSFVLSARLAVHPSPSPHPVVQPIGKRRMDAFANVACDAEIFVRDPVSKNGAAHFSRVRPSRSWKVLDPEREVTSLGNLPPGKAPRDVQLVDPDPKGPDYQVLNVRLVDPPLAETDPKEVPSNLRGHARTNAAAAVHAFHHVGELFRRLRAYGLPPEEYFIFASRPVDIRYRSGIRPGAGDGRTVNAQVRFILDSGGDGKGRIEACFALADWQNAPGRLPANLPSAAERSPLGVACDPRWCWHEASHVLLAAATGELEMHFAHSAGDALAAILSDPDSELALDETGTLANAGPWRGVTFPWVHIPRRHDRCAHDGWGWTGPMNGRERHFVSPGFTDKRGYWTEQILSSALFRLYRAIGGDSEATDASGRQLPALAERTAAADYAAYLIMRAIQSLGPAVVTPSTSADDFADAMGKADIATAGAPGPGGYAGGSVHKVIQWAFQRQGLYAVPTPDSPVAGPEERALVDLHIEDQRAMRDGPYSPVDLCGTAWHAHAKSLRLRSAPKAGRRNEIRIKVENRGPNGVASAQIDVWIAAVNGALRAYPDATVWQHVAQQSGPVPGAAGGKPGSAKFSIPWTPAAPGTEYAVLVSASCAADRSNIDPAAGLPCASVPGPLNILVACDNNLALALFRTP
jgi:hypothetical protein